MVKEWACALPSEYLYENYSIDVADKLHRLELDFLINGGELSKGYTAWARENLPNIVKPQIYFIPLLEWLDDKGIWFKSI